MKELRFEWSMDKAKANVRSHGVPFEEAKTVFYDENAIEFYDQDHSFKEQMIYFKRLLSRAENRCLQISIPYAGIHGRESVELQYRPASTRGATRIMQNIYCSP